MPFDSPEKAIKKRSEENSSSEVVSADLARSCDIAPAPSRPLCAPPSGEAALRGLLGHRLAAATQKIDIGLRGAQDTGLRLLALDRRFSGIGESFLLGGDHARPFGAHALDARGLEAFGSPEWARQFQEFRLSLGVHREESSVCSYSRFRCAPRTLIDQAEPIGDRHEMEPTNIGQKVESTQLELPNGSCEAAQDLMTALVQEMMQLMELAESGQRAAGNVEDARRGLETICGDVGPWLTARARSAASCGTPVDHEKGAGQRAASRWLQSPRNEFVEMVDELQLQVHQLTRRAESDAANVRSDLDCLRKDLDAIRHSTLAKAPTSSALDIVPSAAPPEVDRCVRTEIASAVAPLEQQLTLLAEQTTCEAAHVNSLRGALIDSAAMLQAELKRLEEQGMAMQEELNDIGTSLRGEPKSLALQHVNRQATLTNLDCGDSTEELKLELARSMELIVEGAREEIAVMKAGVEVNATQSSEQIVQCLRNEFAEAVEELRAHSLQLSSRCDRAAGDAARASLGIESLQDDLGRYQDELSQQRAAGPPMTAKELRIAVDAALLSSSEASESFRVELQSLADCARSAARHTATRRDLANATDLLRNDFARQLEESSRGNAETLTRQELSDAVELVMEEVSQVARNSEAVAGDLVVAQQELRSIAEDLSILRASQDVFCNEAAIEREALDRRLNDLRRELDNSFAEFRRELDRRLTETMLGLPSATPGTKPEDTERHSTALAASGLSPVVEKMDRACQHCPDGRLFIGESLQKKQSVGGCHALGDNLLEGGADMVNIALAHTKPNDIEQIFDRRLDAIRQEVEEITMPLRNDLGSLTAQMALGLTELNNLRGELTNFAELLTHDLNKLADQAAECEDTVTHQELTDATAFLSKELAALTEQIAWHEVAVGERIEACATASDAAFPKKTVQLATRDELVMAKDMLSKELRLMAGKMARFENSATRQELTETNEQLRLELKGLIDAKFLHFENAATRQELADTVERVKRELTPSVDCTMHGAQVALRHELVETTERLQHELATCASLRVTHQDLVDSSERLRRELAPMSAEKPASRQELLENAERLKCELVPHAAVAPHCDEKTVTREQLKDAVESIMEEVAQLGERMARGELVAIEVSAAHKDLADLLEDVSILKARSGVLSDFANVQKDAIDQRFRNFRQEFTDALVEVQCQIRGGMTGMATPQRPIRAVGRVAANGPDSPKCLSGLRGDLTALGVRRDFLKPGLTTLVDTGSPSEPPATPVTPLTLETPFPLTLPADEDMF